MHQIKSLAAYLIAASACITISSCQPAKKIAISETVKANSGHLITVDGFTFRDLNKNAKLDVYEDRRQPVAARIKDILSQMAIEEKAGMMFINGARVNDDGSIRDQPGRGMFAFAPNALGLARDKKMNHFNLWAIPSVSSLAVCTTICRNLWKIPQGWAFPSRLPPIRETISPKTCLP